MAFRVAIGKSASKDLFAIYDWYGGESQVALSNFSKNFFIRLGEILKNPEAFGLVRQRPKYRKAKLKRFPYYVVYRVDEQRNQIFIAAVVHTKRNPTNWISKLR